MKSNAFVTFAVLPLISSAYLTAAEPYAAYQGAKFKVDKDLVRATVVAATQELMKTYSTANPPPSSVLKQMISSMEPELLTKTWKVATPPGRMPLPEVLIVPTTWGEGSHNLGYLASDNVTVARFEVYEIVSGLLLNFDPDAAFAIMGRRADDPSVTTADLLHLKASLMTYWPGETLSNAINRDSWNKLHNAQNPCCRLVSLLNFQSVKFSGDELLGIYKECLFGACSYLEMCALEVIFRTRDFRPEVLALLREYLSSQPLENDGTLVPVRSHFRDLQEGAKSLIEMGSKELNQAAPQQGQSSQFGAAEVASQSSKNEPKIKPLTSDEKVTSTPWSVGAVLIVAAFGLLLLLLKRIRQTQPRE